MNRRNFLTVAIAVPALAILGPLAYRKGVQGRINRGESLVGERIETDEFLIVRDNTVIDRCKITCRGIYVPPNTLNYRITNNVILGGGIRF